MLEWVKVKHNGDSYILRLRWNLGKDSIGINDYIHLFFCLFFSFLADILNI